MLPALNQIFILITCYQQTSADIIHYHGTRSHSCYRAAFRRLLFKQIFTCMSVVFDWYFLFDKAALRVIQETYGGLFQLIQRA